MACSRLWFVCVVRKMSQDVGYSSYLVQLLLGDFPYMCLFSFENFLNITYLEVVAQPISLGLDSLLLLILTL